MSASHKEVRATQIGFTTELDACVQCHFKALDDQERLRIKEQEDTAQTEPRVAYGLQLRYLMIQQLLGMLCGFKEQAPAMPGYEVTPVQTEKIELTEHYFEHESVEIGMQGMIKTDSMCIDIDISLSMSRSFVSTHRIDTSAQFYDPLVINLRGELPELENKLFSFDIDNNGSCDQISTLKEGNGFLAYDANNNGCIDEGSELFGTLTGDGFKELGRYDSDRNGWIDENDPILENLQVWQKTDTKSELVTLGEIGIGAIYLGSADGAFTYKNAEQEALGRLRSTGLFLHENGKAGTVAQIDFARDHTAERKTPLAQILSAV